MRQAAGGLNIQEFSHLLKKAVGAYQDQPGIEDWNHEELISIVRDSLENNGLFLVNLLSTKSGSHRKGVEIEPGTFIDDSGTEAGVPHHYFDEEGIRDLFKSWKFLILSEQVNTYIETEDEFYKTNPFPYTKWNIIVQKV